MIGLVTQALAAPRLFIEQRLELLYHEVHGQHHAPQLRGFRQLRYAEELTACNGLGLLDHIVERAQLTP